MTRRKLQFIPQRERGDCGISCFAMIAGYYGRDVAQQELSSRASKDGMTIAELVSMASDEGMSASARRISSEALRRLSTPAILHWGGDHFVVCERDDGTTTWILDPATGPRAVTRRELAEMWDGVIVTLKPGTSFERRRRHRRTLTGWGRAFPYAAGMVGVIIASNLLIDCLAIGVPLAIKFLFDHVVPTADRVLLLSLIGVTLLVTLTRALVIVVRWRVTHGFRARMDVVLADVMVGKVIALPIAFHAKRHDGVTAARLRSLLDLRNDVVNVMNGVFDAVLLVVLSLGLVAYHLKLGLVLLGFVALRILLNEVAVRKARGDAGNQAKERVAFSGTVTEAFSSPEVTKALNLEAYFQNKLDAHKTRELVARASSGRAGEALLAVLPVLNATVSAAVIVLCGRAVLNGEMSMGLFAAALMFEAIISARASSMVLMLQQAPGVFACMREIEDILDGVVEPRREGFPRLDFGRIEVDDLTVLNGVDRNPILRGLHLHVRPGEHVAIAGACGAGKTTLLRSLIGFHEVASGEVRFDGVQARTIDPEHLRSRIACLLSSSVLLPGSLRENLSIEQPDDVAAAKDLLQELGLGGRLALDLLDWDSPIQPTQFSSGERQRLLICRAFMKRVALMLFDEATSALDDETEARVLRMIARSRRTVVSVTHRESVMRAADRVVLLSDGRVVGDGTYASLLQSSAEFRALLASSAEPWKGVA